ncbi:TerC/Alx family metal homeostasis membrane protein [Streptacidiphilus monticola]|uniref:TerC/Alx family metal homeostasis membrane protein n=1 Tax=Streptacidiphilus monticola TaxID=2161674 RepID=A0ABW1G1D2_9ACTN
MHVSAALWATTVLVLTALIAVDLLARRRPHEVSLREAGLWTVVWVGLAGLFLGFLAWRYGSEPAGEFLAGYVTEKALSVDNLFVFVLIMARFAVPKAQQERVLMVGILIALVLRAVFIAAGAALVASFSWVFFLFGGFLVWTAWKVFREARAGHGEQTVEEREEGRLQAFLTRRFPTRPLLAVILAIGVTDVLFAMDSIPAIFGLTQNAYLVFTANAFALMGLRQLYFLIGGLLDRLVHLSYGLAAALGFIGVKLVLHALHENGWHGAPEVGTGLSLSVIGGVLALTTVTSLLATRRR